MKRSALLGMALTPLVLLPVVFWTNPGFLSGPDFGVGALIAIIYAVVGTYALSLLVLVPIVLLLSALRVLTFVWMVLACAVAAYAIPFVQVFAKSGWPGVTRAFLSDSLSFGHLGWGMYGAILGAAFCLIVGMPAGRKSRTQADRGF